MCKIDLFHQNKHDDRLFFSIFLVKFLRNNIKQVVSSAAFGAPLGAIKIAILKAMTVQRAFSDDYWK